jgi:hypothetical protein
MFDPNRFKNMLPASRSFPSPARVVFVFLSIPYVKQLNKFMFGKINFNHTWSVLLG